MDCIARNEEDEASRRESHFGRSWNLNGLAPVTTKFALRVYEEGRDISRELENLLDSRLRKSLRASLPRPSVICVRVYVARFEREEINLLRTNTYVLAGFTTTFSRRVLVNKSDELSVSCFDIVAYIPRESFLERYIRPWLDIVTLRNYAQR